MHMVISGDMGEDLLDALISNDQDYARWIIGRDKQCVNWQDPNTKISILHTLVYNNSYDSINLLLSHGANPNCKNNNEETPLHWAIRMNSLACAQILIEFGADVNAPDHSGSTALHIAAFYGIPEIVPLLLSHNSRTDCVDIEGKTALTIAMEQSDNDASLACGVIIRRFDDIVSRTHSQLSRMAPIPDIGSLSLSQQPQGMPSIPVPSKVDGPEVQEKKRGKGLHTSPLLQKSSSSKPFIAGSTLRVQEWSSEQLVKSYSSPTLRESASPKKLQLMRDRTTSLPRPGRQSGGKEQSSHQSTVQLFASRETSPRKKGRQQEPPRDEYHWAPFLPKAAAELDVIVSVEHCNGCHNHNWSLWHKEECYCKSANKSLRAVLSAIRRKFGGLRVFAFTVTKAKRLGALEVVISVKTPAEGNQWESKTVHSKLETKSWPRRTSMVSSALNFIHSVLCKHATESLLQLQEQKPMILKCGSEDRLDEDVLRYNQFDTMYSHWQDRLKSNNTAPHGNTSELYNELLTADGKFLTSIPPAISESREDLEISALKHFLVFDGRFRDDEISEEFTSQWISGK
eukprot:CAMPEP_0185036744 /NCGR_PEP_ID=MMETSP1103-20130426/30142_1 /TAXON_ID=36769 /ORGANISM="Paraphysomonas bandaiensis, Strain Caron Lab Isolate" /LENGTH=570 /DNA_ID=CAMNT_0027574403 /DNA_START=87 /DNA_END=1802 /DNA_ORIENTATION=-